MSVTKVQLENTIGMLAEFEERVDNAASVFECEYEELGNEVAGEVADELSMLHVSISETLQSLEEFNKNAK